MRLFLGEISFRISTMNESLTCAALDSASSRVALSCVLVRIQQVHGVAPQIVTQPAYEVRKKQFIGAIYW